MSPREAVTLWGPVADAAAGRGPGPRQLTPGAAVELLGVSRW